MAGTKAALSVNVVADASKAVKAFKGTGDAGKDMAEALAKAADKMDADLKNTAKIADKLAQALGPDFKTTVGDNINDIAAQFNRAGLSIDDVDGNLDGIVSGLQRVAAEADETAAEIGKVGDETGKAGSVMSNFVGNSVQEIPALSNAFGPLNTAIGQMAEAAAEGQLKMSSLAKVAGPMAALSVVMFAISKGAENTARRAEETTAAINEMTRATGRAQLQATQLAIGKGWKQVAIDGKDAKDMFADIAAENLVGAKNAIDYAKANGLMDNSLRLLEEAVNDEIAAQKAQTYNQTIYENNTKQTVHTVQDYVQANKDAANAVWNLYDAQLGLIDLQLGARGATRNYRRALEEYNKVSADGTATEDEKAEAFDNVQSAALQLAAANGEVASASGTAADGAQAQIDTLNFLAATLAPDSALRTNLQGYIDQLTLVARIESLRTQLTRMSASGSMANYDRVLSELNSLLATSDLPNAEGYAMGTKNAQAGLAWVGERGPELIDFGGGERVYNGQQLAGMGAGTSAGITINMPAGANGDDVVRALQRWVRANGQLPLPVSSKTVR
jgi:hypothetical protein